MENYIKAKEDITKNQKVNDVCVLNYEDEVLRKFGESLSMKVLWFDSKKPVQNGCYLNGEKIIYKGIAERVFSESKKGVPHIHYDNWVPINGEYLKVVYDDLVTSEGVSVLFFTTMAAVEMKRKGVVDAIVVANKAGLSTYKAKVYIDCTGDGDLAAWAGADFVIGDESGSVQEGTLCFTLSNVDPYEFSLIGNVHTNRKDGPIHSIYGNPKYPLVKDKHMNDKLIGPGI